MTAAPVLLCAKSPWRPSIRREHALARAAATVGQPVVYIERPVDVRAARHLPALPGYLRGLAGPGPGESDVPGLRVIRRGTLVPGHRAPGWQRLDCAGLTATLRRLGPADARAVVVNLPWQWPAVSPLRGVRRVADLADDWTRLMPHRRDAIARLYRQIAAEADEVVVAAPELAELLGGRAAVVVRNAAGPEALAPELSPVPGRRRLVYLGTLSERFDTGLVRALLAELPGWHLALYGPCQYRGQGDRPDAALAALLAQAPDRVRWHGPVGRVEAVRALDGADVLILPNDPARGSGQDSMKLYDYAARGRPIVCTPLWTDSRPPHVAECDGASAFAAAVRAGVAEPAEWAAHRRAWAARNSWSARLPRWLAAVSGVPGPVPCAS